MNMSRLANNNENSNSFLTGKYTILLLRCCYFPNKIVITCEHGTKLSLQWLKNGILYT